MHERLKLGFLFVASLLFLGSTAAQEVQVEDLTASGVNYTANESHVTFHNSEYLNKAISYKDLFIPEQHQDDLYGSFDTVSYSDTDRLYVQLQYQYNYNSGDTDDDVPDSFSRFYVNNQGVNVGFNQENDGLDRVFNSSFLAPNVNNQDVRIGLDVEAHYEHLILNYTYRDASGEVVGSYEDVYSGEEPEKLAVPDGNILKYERDGEYQDRLGMTYDKLHDQEEKEVTAVILHEQGNSFRGFTASTGTVEEVDSSGKYNEVVNRANSLGMTDILVDDISNYNVRAFNVTVPPDTETRLEAFQKSPKVHNGSMSMYLLGSFAGGSGTSSDPYQIETCQQLQDMSSDLSASYELISNVDCSGFGSFQPVGNSDNRFTGILNGNGYKVDNLYIDSSAGYVGLFGYLDNAEIRNVAVTNADITSTGDYTTAGTLVSLGLDSNINNVFATGQVTSQNDDAGGLVGQTQDGTIYRSFSTANVTAPNGIAGGFLGNNGGGNFTYSYSTGTVSGNTEEGFTESYYDLSALNIKEAYWDTESSGTSTSSGENTTGLTTIEMTENAEENMQGFDFDGIWETGVIGAGYPVQSIFCGNAVECNTPPDSPSLNNPSDGGSGFDNAVTLEVGVSDPDGDSMSVTFYDASDDSQIGSTQTSVSDGGTASVTWDNLDWGTEYSWYAVADDSSASTQSSTWSFTTAPPDTTPPLISFNADTTAEGSYSRSWIFANYSASDNEAISQVLSELGASNQTVSNSANGNYWLNHTGLSDGSYTLQGYAEDEVGNTAATAERTITLDTTAPSTNDNYSVSGFTNQFGSSVSVELTADDAGSSVANITYCVDGGSCTTVSGSTAEVTITGDGNHSLEYYATDTEGNVENTNTEHIALDNTAPTANIVDPSNQTYTSSDLALTVDRSDATSGVQTDEYSKNGGAFTSFNPDTTLSWGEGTNDVRYRATDRAGNTATDQVYFTVDSVAPTTTDNAPSGWSDSNVAVTLSCSDSTTGCATTEYRIDGGSWTTGTGFEVTEEGNHTVEYYSTDSAGNIESTSTVYVAVDKTDPVISFNENATDSNSDYKNDWILNSVTASDTTSGAQIVRESFRSTNSSFTTASSPLFEENHTDLSEDVTYKFYAWTKDKAGNYAQTGTRTVTVNQTYNDVSYAGMDIQSPKNTSYSSTSVDINVTPYENTSTWKYNLDGSGNTTFEPNTSITGLAEGQHELVLWANDTEGNYGKETVYFSVDTIAPDVSLLKPENTTYNTSSVPLNVTGSADITDWVRQVDGSNTSFAPNTTFEPGNGQYTLAVYGSDAAGNTGESSEVVFTVDAPTSGGGDNGGGSSGGGSGAPGDQDQPDENVSDGQPPTWNVSSSRQQMIVDAGEPFQTTLRFEISEGETEIQVSCENGDPCQWLNEVPSTVNISESMNTVEISGRAPGTIASGKHEFDLVVEDTGSGRTATLPHIVNSNKVLNQLRKLIEVAELEPEEVPVVGSITDEDARSIPVPLALPLLLVPALFFGLVSLVERQFDVSYMYFKFGVTGMLFVVLLAVI